MRIFSCVVQAGNLSAAGRELGMSAASVSRKISVMERAIGVRLLSRTTRKVELTELGSLYFEKVLRIVEQIDAAHDSISRQKGTSGTLTVRTRPGICKKFLFLTLPEFQIQYPDITINIVLADNLSDPVGGKFDVGIQVGLPEDEALIVRRLSRGVEYVLCASPTYLNNRPEIRSPQDLDDHNCLSVSNEIWHASGYSIWHYRNLDETKEVKARGSLVANDAEMLHHASLAGIGITLLPGWMVADDLAMGRVRRILPQYEFTPATFDHGIYAVFMESEKMMLKVRVFVNFLVDVFRKQEIDMARIGFDIRRRGVSGNERPHDALRWVSR